MANAIGTRAAWSLLLALASGCGGASQAPSTQAPGLEPPNPAQQRHASEPAVSKPSAAIIADLEDPARVEAAVLRLIKDFKSAAQNGSKTPEARAFVASYTEPLSAAYVDQHAQLSAQTRKALINLLVSFDDPRTVPAHAKAITIYAETRSGVDEAIGGCQAAQSIKDERLAQALLQAFEKIDMSSDDGRRFSRHLQAAMFVNAAPGASSVLIAHLRAPIKRPEIPNDKLAIQSYQNELFWQTTAAMLLGELAAPAAAKPLLLALLEPTKHAVHPHAELALIKLGAPSARLAEQLLTADDPELVAQSRTAEPDLAEPHVFHGADLLIKLAPVSSRDKLEQAWRATQNPVSRVMLALALARLPKTDSALEIWKKTYATTRLQTTLPRGESALEALAESAPFWFEPALVPWLNERTRSAPGKGPRKGDLQRTLVISMSYLVTKADQKASHKVAQEFGGRTGTPAFAHAAELLQKCEQDASCYLQEIKTGPSNPEQLLRATKGAIMVGIFGTEGDRDALLTKLGGLEDRKLQDTVARVVEHMSPGKDPAVLEALTQLTRSAPGRTASVQVESLTPISLALFRMRAR